MTTDDRLLAALRAGTDEFEAAEAEPTTAPAFSRLKATLMRPEERLAPFADRLASMMDVTAEAARGYLARIFDPDAWEGLIPNVSVIHLAGGPSTEGANVGFVRIEPGAGFPMHSHLGDERALILQGTLKDSTFGDARPGDSAAIEGKGQPHALEVTSDEPLIYAVVTWGIEIEGVGKIDT